MNARDILKYGHHHVHEVVEGLSDAEWQIPEVTTTWSVKDSIGHLGAYEILLGDVFVSVLDPGTPTPVLAKMQSDARAFNDSEAESRRVRTHGEILDEYNAAYDRVMSLFERLSPEKLREPGTIPWYGPDYSLDDFIVYANYAHKREHTAQIRLFRKRRGA